MTDYIVVGAGSAGATIASRLTEDPSVHVLLIEAGGERIPPASRIPAAFSKLFGTPCDWNYWTEPEAELAHRPLYWPRGKLLGGSSAINAMLWTRGEQSDFDHWEALGNAGWSYRELAPFFDRAELPEDTAPSRDRPGITVSRLRTVNPITEALLAAARGYGLPLNDGFGGGRMAGAGLFRVSQHRGRRVSAAAGYLEPIRFRPNLTIASHATVGEIIVAGSRATGVRYLRNGTITEARGRVILAAGAIGSPEILLRSGIGPARDLEAAGIPVRHDLPGVGKNLQDHLSTGVMYHCRRAVSMATAERLDQVANYFLRRRGPLTSPVAEAGAFLRLDSHASAPDLELIFAPSFFVEHGRANPPGHGYTIAAILQHPISRGEITLVGPAPHTVAIRANYLADGRDRARLIAGLEVCQAIAARPELADLRGEAFLPAPGDHLETFVRTRSETLYHPVGTCKMGGDALAVVTDRLAVRGLDDLWVGDASIMPTITTGHPNAAVIAIGERLATWVTA